MEEKQQRDPAVDEAVTTREFKLSKGEYQRVLRRILLRRSVVGLLFVWLAAAYLILGGMSQSSAGQVWVTLTGSAPVLLLAIVSTLWVTLIAPWRLSNSRYSRPAFQAHHYRFDTAGISVETEDGSRVTRPYAAVMAVEQTPELILLQQDSGQYFVIPRLAFADSGDIDTVLLRVKPPLANASAGQRTEAPAVPWGAALGRNLRAGLRLASFRPVRAAEFHASFDQILLLGFVTTVVGIALSRIGVDGPAEFSAYALLELGTGYLLLLIGACLVAARWGKSALLMPFLVVLLSVEPLFEAVVSLLYTQLELDSDTASWGVFLALFLWMMAVWWRAVRSVFATDRIQTSGAVGLLFAVAVLPVFWLPQSDYWYGTETGLDEPAPERLSAEDVYYAQPRMVEQALDALSGERPGVVDLYHIGFGSYAHQGVFRREVNHVREILDARFDTRDRSLLLINDRKTVDQDPIASATNLELALRGVARRMNPEEDVLFLYLTSHGSKGAELSVSFWPLGLNQLSSGALRRMLDEAGIRWRVVVISACYAGSFMDALADDHTLVITAAAKTRTSFGCSNENEYTYFGEAYFKHGLSATVSFAEAYDLAREWVSAREQGEGLEPSMPMLHMGEDIEKHLTQLEQRLAMP